MSSYKVALITHEFPPYLIGGMASHCYDLAYSLSKKKIPITVFCGMAISPQSEKINSYLRIVRLPLLNLPPRFLWFQIDNFKFLLKAINDYDIIHCVNPLASGIFSFFGKKMKKIIVTTLHEIFLSDLKTLLTAPFSELTLGDLSIQGISYPINEFLIRTCLTNSDHVIVCGNSALQDMRCIYPHLNYEKVSVIYNGINLDKFDNVKCQLINNTSIIFYGRLVWIKGVLYLLKAIPFLKKDFSNLSVKIVGKGPLERKIKAMIKKFKLEENIQLYGYLDHTRLIKEISRSSIVVLPSLYEVGPFISGLEAMACKKTLITFDLPFAREFIRPMYNGVLARGRDVIDLANKIRLVLSDHELRRKIGENAFKYVKKRHNWNLIAEKYIEIYENCLSR